MDERGLWAEIEGIYRDRFARFVRVANAIAGADVGYREIAETLEIEVGTVSATPSAAHASLRAVLEEVQV
jgi:DNA-directed RNA polymerase specialized sigma24 family protein